MIAPRKTPFDLAEMSRFAVSDRRVPITLYHDPLTNYVVVPGVGTVSMKDLRQCVITSEFSGSAEQNDNESQVSKGTLSYATASALGRLRTELEERGFAVSELSDCAIVDLVLALAFNQGPELLA